MAGILHSAPEALKIPWALNGIRRGGSNTGEEGETVEAPKSC